MHRSVRRYRWLARLWGHCFVVAGLLFAVVPERVAALLEWQGRLVGLEGDIRFGQGTLAWALSLSLMATLVLLAYRSAARPHDPAPYRALMLSKLTSTGVFVYLAFVQGPVWILAAQADFFVALTLFALRLPVANEGPARGFAGRYLEWMGVDAAGRMHFTDMLARMPIPMRTGIHLANGLFTYVAPAIFARRLCTASSLDDAAMQKLVDRIRTSRLQLIRVLWILIHQPACGALARSRPHAGHAPPAPGVGSASSLPVLGEHPTAAE